MNKQAYRQARALVRANGTYAYRWMTDDARKVLHSLATPSDDYLSERAWFVAYNLRSGRGKGGTNGTHNVQAVPCPSQRSAMHAATVERTLQRHADALARIA